MDRQQPDGVGRRNRFEKMDSKTSAVTCVRGRFFLWNHLLFVYGTGRRRARAGKASVDERGDAGSQGAAALCLLGAWEVDRWPGDIGDDVSGTGGMRWRGNLDGLELWRFFMRGVFELWH